MIDIFTEIKQRNAIVRDQIYKGFIGGEELLVKAHEVGEIHPKHSDWVWTEYAPGKFDWRKKKSDEPDPRTDNYKTASEKTGERNPGRDSYGWKISAAGYDARELDAEEE